MDGILNWGVIIVYVHNTELRDRNVGSLMKKGKSKRNLLPHSRSSNFLLIENAKPLLQRSVNACVRTLRGGWETYKSNLSGGGLSSQTGIVPQNPHPFLQL